MGIAVGLLFDKENESIKKVALLMKKYEGLYNIEDGLKDADVYVELGIDQELAAESYKIIKADDSHFVINGADNLGLIYGAGRFLHRGYENLKDEYCIPQKSIRAIYYATHFGNFYQSAPIEKIIEHMEEQMLWGCNCVSMWFDMHHFSGMNDPEAVKLLNRLRDICFAAKERGLKTSLTMLANEYYCGAPENLLAENSTDETGYFLKMAGFYETEICPSTPEGEELIIKARREMLEFFSTTELDFVSLWPYDQGGCTCPKCRPWGGNGFLNISKKIAKELRKFFPNAKCILSAWRFDSFTKGEWDAVLSRLDELSEDFNILMADFASPTTPPDLATRVKTVGMKLVGFPDISMFATPWGGFGAAPATEYLEKVYMENEISGDGGFCYSEGIFEDINKVLMLSLYFGNGTRCEIIEDYFRYYFGENAVEYADEFIYCLEKSRPRCRIDADGTKNNYPREKVTGELPRFEIKNTETVKREYELAKILEESVCDKVKSSPRFKMLYLRAVIDSELTDNNGMLTDNIETAAKELEKIYYAENADYVVSPITVKAIRETRGHI